jgi:hypothetical protein
MQLPLILLLLLPIAACSTWRGVVPSSVRDTVRLDRGNFKVVGRFSGSAEALYGLRLFGPAKQDLANQAWADLSRKAGLEGSNRSAVNIIVERKTSWSPFHLKRTLTVSGLVLEFQARPFELADGAKSGRIGRNVRFTSFCRSATGGEALRDAISAAFAPLADPAVGLEYLPASELKEELAENQRFADALMALYVRKVSVFVFIKVYDLPGGKLSAEVQAYETMKGRIFWKGEVLISDRAKIPAAVAPALAEIRKQLGTPAGAQILRGR